MRLSFLVISLLSVSAWAQIQQSVPVKFLNAEMTRPASTELKFSVPKLFYNNYVEIKHAEWKACHQQHGAHFESGYKENLKYFLETTKYLSNIEEMDSKNRTEGAAAMDPWSGDYWAYARGLLGYRFQDGPFMKNDDWYSRYEYVQKNTASLQIENQGEAGVNALSPSEKYDLIVGDLSFSLTNSMWEQGKVYYDDSGKVEEWMGICHGWASASIILPRPTKSVQILTDDEKWQVSFNPSEIKGLASYSWATNSYPSRSLGSRCNVKNPERDENGRIVDPSCLDLNPAAWHMSVVHILGQLKRPFVMDATFDYEVWNQPVKSYKYSYFNLNTGQNVNTLSEAIVSKENLTNDKFAMYRSEKLASIVGIRMQVAYTVESVPNTKTSDSPDKDVIRWVQYSYDLELDQANTIIGGEWHTRAHPDFIWTPYPNAKPLSPYDVKLLGSVWDDSQPLPAAWISAAKKASPRGLILNHITENILQKAARE